jgi:cytoplasmic iron level regulating protein YaaA (DUF328/UPF0246 family)
MAGAYTKMAAPRLPAISQAAINQAENQAENQAKNQAKNQAENQAENQDTIRAWSTNLLTRIGEHERLAVRDIARTGCRCLETRAYG